MKRVICFCLFALPAFWSASPAQTKVSPAGHWEGSIAVPGMELGVLIDLAQDTSGKWIGDIDIPAQRVKDMQLKNISVSGSAVSFDLAMGMGEPAFKGKLSEDGNTLSGDFTQGGNNLPFTLKRTGEAKVVVPAKNAELPSRFAGKWEGTLEPPMGGKLRLVFHLENKDGAAAGTIDSLDQGAMGIPMDEISVTDGSIKISVPLVSGSYAGKLSEDGKTLTGEWTQSGAALPLVLTKANS